MKKIILFIAFLATVFQANSQEYFTLTQKGLVPKSGDTKNYIVIDKAGSSQQELFNSIKAFATQLYASPKDVISETGNEMIVLNGVSTRDISMKKALGYLDVTMNYTLTFHFKDGKIRIDSPSINKMSSESRTLGGQLGSFYAIYLSKEQVQNTGAERIFIFDGKDGKKVKEDIKGKIESFFNTLIDSAIKFTAPQKENW